MRAMTCPATVIEGRQAARTVDRARWLTVAQVTVHTRLSGFSVRRADIAAQTFRPSRRHRGWNRPSVFYICSTMTNLSKLSRLPTAWRKRQRGVGCVRPPA